MDLTVINGERGCGKTTLLREYVDAAARAGRTVGGIASPVVYENGRRLGYDLLDLRRGVCRALARIVSGPEAVPTIGPFRFEEAALAEGNAAIVAAVRDGLDVVAIDEVGPLEWEGKGWAAALTHVLRSGEAGQELIIVVRTSLCDQLPDRFPSPLWRTAKRLSPA
ncbi:MAG: DUF2478 domain-containing protein [Phycisphaerae bacterium]|nr:DUF2478 domain-containing protein [Phycisphaerae bacterium]